MTVSRLTCLVSCLAVLGLQPVAGFADEAPVGPAKPIGWLQGACLASAEPGLAPGTEVHIVLLDEPQSTLRVKVVGQAKDSATCGPLLPGRSGLVGGNKANYFQVSDWKKDSGDIAIGLIGTAAPLIENGIARATVDGVPGVVFTQCATSEGLRFAAWAGKPGSGEPIWDGYYGLDYDQEPTCP